MTGGGWGGGGCEVPEVGFRCGLGERGGFLVEVWEGDGGCGSENAVIGVEGDEADGLGNELIAGMGALGMVVKEDGGLFAVECGARRGRGGTSAGSHDGSNDAGMGARAAGVKLGGGVGAGACRL